MWLFQLLINDVIQVLVVKRVAQVRVLNGCDRVASFLIGKAGIFAGQRKMFGRGLRVGVRIVNDQDCHTSIYGFTVAVATTCGQFLWSWKYIRAALPA